MREFVISGLSDGFESGATAVYLPNIENCLIGKRKDSNYIARTYTDDVDGRRLT